MTNKHATARQFALSLLLAFSLAACGGGSSSGNTTGGGGGTNAKPEAAISFPPTSAIAHGEVLVVRGTASDDSGIAAVTINGIDAVSNDGFANWTASVPLVDGDNTITVQVEDDAGEVTADAASISVKKTLPPYTLPTGVKIDEANDRAIILNGAQFTVEAADLDTGERSILSSIYKGTGPQFRPVQNLDIDSLGEVAYVAELDGRILRVDLETGNREVMSSADVGTGPALDTVRDVALDEINDRLFVVQTGGNGQVIEIDLDTGDRTLLLESDPGSGTYYFPLGVEWYGANGELVMSDAVNGITVLEVGPNTPSHPITDDTAVIDGIYDLTIDSANDQAYLIDQGGALLRMPFDTGVIEEVSGPNAGSGIELGAPNAIDLDVSGNRTIIVDLAESRVIAIDLATGERSTFADDEESRIGSGPILENGLTGGVDLSSGVAYRIDTYANQLVSFDLASGNRSLVADSLPPFIDAMAADGGLVYFVDDLDVYSVDATAGTHTLETTMANVPAGNTAVFDNDIAIDLPSNRLIIARGPSNAVVMEISLDTFADQVFSGDSVGTGDALREVSSLAVDTQRSRVVFLDEEPDELRAIDFGSRNRSDLVADGDNTGASIDDVRGLSMGTGGNHLYTLDVSQQSMVRINLDTLERDHVAGIQAGSNSAFAMAETVGVDETSGLAYIMSVDALYVADMETGEVVMISR